jgi:transcriptional regulator with XRE-family HTH domain
MTQRELAERLQLKGWDVSRAGIAKIEAGLCQVTDVEVTHLAEALGVSVAHLFNTSD